MKDNTYNIPSMEFYLKVFGQKISIAKLDGMSIQDLSKTFELSWKTTTFFVEYRLYDKAPTIYSHPCELYRIPEEERNISFDRWLEQELWKALKEEKGFDEEHPVYPNWYLCFLSRYRYSDEEIQEKFFSKKEELKKDEKNEFPISKHLETSIVASTLRFKLEDLYKLPLEMFHEHFDTIKLEESFVVPYACGDRQYNYKFPLFQLELYTSPQKDITVGEWVNEQLLDYISNQEEYQTSVPSYPEWYQYFIEKFQIDPMDEKTLQKKKEN